MALITKNMNIGEKKFEGKTHIKSVSPQEHIVPEHIEITPTVTETQVKIELKQNIPLKPVKEVSLVAKTQIGKEHGILLVDGKEKKVSKHSAYILDMLTLDND